MAIADCAATRHLLLQAARALLCMGSVTPRCAEGPDRAGFVGMRVSQPNRRCIALLLVVGGAAAAREHGHHHLVFVGLQPPLMEAMHHHGNAM